MRDRRAPANVHQVNGRVGSQFPEGGNSGAKRNAFTISDLTILSSCRSARAKSRPVWRNSESGPATSHVAAARHAACAFRPFFASFGMAAPLPLPHACPPHGATPKCHSHSIPWLDAQIRECLGPGSCMKRIAASHPLLFGDCLQPSITGGTFMKSKENRKRRQKETLVVAPADTFTWAVAFSRRLIPGALFRTREAAAGYARALAKAAGLSDRKVRILA